MMVPGWMDGVGGLARPKLRGQVRRQQDVGELGLSVGIPRAVAGVTGEVVQANALGVRPGVGCAGRHDDPPGARQLVDKAGDENNVSNMVGEELSLNTVL